MNACCQRLLLIFIVFVIPAGCAVGPDFVRPETPLPENYAEGRDPTRTVAAAAKAGEAQNFAFTENLPGEWWQLFGSPELDALIKRGIGHNATLAAAQAALIRAQEDLRAVQGAVWSPAVDANLQTSRQRTSDNAGLGNGNTYTLYNTSVSVSYTLDIFGGGRRQIESYRALVDYQRYLYEATYLTLTANIVTTAIQEASLRAQIEATREIIAAEEEQLNVLTRQFELGAISKTSVLSQETQVALARTSLPPLEKQLTINRHALAVLIGQFPGNAQMPSSSLDSLRLPQNLPVSLPSDLVRQRPDIQASEALLHQASAAVGVATANLYPQITLSAGYGFQAVSTDILFNGQSIVWNLGAGLLQPLFRGGELTAKRRSAIAAYDQAVALYRQVVLRAFQDVADSLRAIEADARSLQVQIQAEEAAKATQDLVEKQFELGAVKFLALLIAKRDYQRARISVITARAQRHSDTAALFQALGGGWWNRAPATANEEPKEKEK